MLFYIATNERRRRRRMASTVSIRLCQLEVVRVDVEDPGCRSAAGRRRSAGDWPCLSGTRWNGHCVLTTSLRWRWTGDARGRRCRVTRPARPPTAAPSCDAPHPAQYRDMITVSYHTVILANRSSSPFLVLHSGATSNSAPPPTENTLRAPPRRRLF